MAVYALGEIMPDEEQVVGALLSALEDKDPRVRYEAILGLSGLQDPGEDVIDALLQGLTDEHNLVRAASASRPIGSNGPPTRSCARRTRERKRSSTAGC
jgi:HEAT repeat protein